MKTSYHLFSCRTPVLGKESLNNPEVRVPTAYIALSPIQVGQSSIFLCVVKSFQAIAQFFQIGKFPSSSVPSFNTLL